MNKMSIPEKAEKILSIVDKMMSLPDFELGFHIGRIEEKVQNYECYKSIANKKVVRK